MERQQCEDGTVIGVMHLQPKEHRGGRNSEAGRQAWDRVPPRASGGNLRCPHLDFRPLAPRSIRIHFLVRSTVCGNLL